MKTNLNWKKYLAALIVTVAIFATALASSSSLNNKKIESLKEIEDKIAIDIMSSETEYSLLSESSCKDLTSGGVLSRELGALAEKLAYSEENLSQKSSDLLRLKTYYTLLQIKDYLLMKKIGVKCDTKPVFILYFYTTNDCKECEQQGYVLTHLRSIYPNLRIYSFDYSLDNPALKTLISLYKVPNTPPVMVINDKLYNGLLDKEKITPLLPKNLLTSTSTTTKALK